MKIINNEALSYDDVLIKPSYSEIIPSQTSIVSKFSKNIEIQIPIVSSAMDTVTDGNMARLMGELGGIGVIHKNYSISDHIVHLKIARGENSSLKTACAVGVGEKELQRAFRLRDEGVSAIVIDTAHGHSLGVVKTLKELKRSCPQQDIVVGNIATLEAAKVLVENGADGVKIGIGPGSICTTRIVAGIGVPQFQALLDCCEYLKAQKVPFIADGGVRYSGDIVKALATGASSVMLGSLLASTDESASENIDVDGKTYKRYRGMGSLESMSRGSKDRYAQSDVKSVDKLVPEGIEGLIESRGSLNDFIYQLIGGLKSGLGYVGAKNLIELEEKVEFVRVSSTSIKENHPHNIKIDVKAPNY